MKIKVWLARLYVAVLFLFCNYEMIKMLTPGNEEVSAFTIFAGLLALGGWSAITGYMIYVALGEPK